MGNYIELGQFKSVRSRAGIKWSKTVGKKTNESRIQPVNHIQLQTTERQRKAEQVGNDNIASVTAAVENAIDDTNRLMPAEFPHEKHA